MSIRKRNEINFKNAIKSAAIFAAVGMLAACGGDSDGSSKADATDGREVATLAEMGRCTSDRDGDTVYVAEKLTDYLCQGGSWVDLSEVPYGKDLKSSSSTESPSGDKTDSTKGFVRENISVTGVAQKGPFQFGSPLILFELKKDLSPSGLVYSDEINSNKGDFVIPKVTLAYPYAKLEVRGLYRNEVTANWSTDSMTLRALTDFSDKRTDANTDDRAQVNINLLTHLEYDRALYLVQEKGYSVYAAKKQAAQEIMTAFEFATAVTYSEDFAIFQNDGVGANTIAGNGTLLAISALIMGNRSDAEIQSAIDKFIADITTDGEWNDLQTKADMADWAYDFDYKTIRASVKSWNILDIPDYEIYLDIYWNNVYGLGGCSKIREGVVAPNSNKLSMYYDKYFICAEVATDSYKWNDATTYEKDTYEWTAGKDGKLKKGNVTDSIYVCKDSHWVVAERETAIGLCTESKIGKVSLFDSVYYICRNNAWEKATVLEYDTYGLAGKEGDVKAGVVNKNKYYVFDNGKWRASANEQEVSLGGCSAAREGEVSKLGKTYYICKSKNWTEATVLEYDTYGWKAGSDGEVKTGSVNTDKYYVYENGKWRASASEIENNLGACVASREGKVDKSGNVYYICKSKTWVTATALEYDTYGWKAGTEGEVKTGSVNTNNYYIYKNKWQAATGVESELGGCIASREGEVNKLANIYYICKSKNWTEATALEYDTYGWEAGSDGEVKAGSVNTNSYYIYKNNKWQVATVVELDLGECIINREGEVSKSGNTYYICKSKTWTEATTLEYDTYGEKCTSAEVGKAINGVVTSSNRYYCMANGWVSLMRGWSWDVPKEVRLNPEITYESITDSRDNKKYKTVTIGSQVWMAENLNYYEDTDLSVKTKSWCYDIYGEKDTSTCDVVGRFYTWAAAMDSVKTRCGKGLKCSPTLPVQGICPTGWHLPSLAEWESLIKAVGGSSIAGKVLKSQTGWFSNGNGTDDFGFSALPAGFLIRRFDGNAELTYFWSSSVYDSDRAYYMYLGYRYDDAALHNVDKDTGASVRCVKNSN